MDRIRHVKVSEMDVEHVADYGDYEFIRRRLIPMSEARQCTVAVYEIPPGKAGYPYHYHMKNEEIFYILSGTGTLRTPEGERTVGAGEIIHFPANENGAHKLTNSSATEMLVYIDFDTHNDLEVAFYPDSDKVGIYGMGIAQMYRTRDEVDYFEGE